MVPPAPEETVPTADPVTPENREPAFEPRTSAPGARARPGRDPRARCQVSLKPFRGRHTGAVAAAEHSCDLDWDATIRAAAPLQKARKRREGPAIIIRPRELRRKLRLIHPGRLLLFLVDISGSMGEGHMGLARKSALLLLEKAYVKRDRVAVVAFRNRTAELLVPPTNRAETVTRTLTSLTCGGLTPLFQGLSEAGRTLERARSGNPALESFLILISDGRANVGSLPGYERMHNEIEALAGALSARDRLTTLFFDTTEQGKEDYPARWLSNRLNARRFLLWKMVSSDWDPAAVISRIMG